jgi:hypothetical protein
MTFIKMSPIQTCLQAVHTHTHTLTHRRKFVMKTPYNSLLFPSFSFHSVQMGLCADCKCAYTSAFISAGPGDEGALCVCVESLQCCSSVAFMRPSCRNYPAEEDTQPDQVTSVQAKKEFVQYSIGSVK